MVVDSTALFAVIFREPERPAFLGAMKDAQPLLISAATLVESYIVALAQKGPNMEPMLDDLLDELGVTTMPVAVEHVRIARRAFRDYGKGRHPAALNFGDLFAYALSKATGEPLLFKGDDFRKTDVEPAL